MAEIKRDHHGKSFRSLVHPGILSLSLAVIGVLVILGLTTGSRPVQALISGPNRPDILLESPPASATAGDQAMISLLTTAPNAEARRVGQLLSLLRRDWPLSRRLTAMTALEQMQDSAVPALVTALSSPDKDVRIAALGVLGWQKASETTNLIVKRLSDPDPDVREAAITALGEIGAIQAIGRLQELQVLQSNFYVEEAAYLAEQRFIFETAASLGLGPSEIHLLVGGSGGEVFAASATNLFALRDGDWQWVAQLPDVPTSMSIGNYNGLIYLASVSYGLYRSADGGQNWERVQFGLDTPTQLSVTAVTLNPANNNQIFIALATSTANSNLKSPLGIFSSEDGGKTWLSLPDSPNEYVTRRLVFDPAMPRYLYGQTGVGNWRYVLTPGSTETFSN